MSKSIPPEHFEALYRRSSDPWDFERSAYEQQKYHDTLERLSRTRYDRILEIGCSIGVLSGHLAARCNAFLGIDCSPLAIERARHRHADNTNTHFDVMTVPAEFPAGVFDLIVLSEVLYFLNTRDLARLADWVNAALASDGELILVNWLGSTETALCGDEAADLFIGLMTSDADQITRWRRPSYRIDRLSPAVG